MFDGKAFGQEVVAAVKAHVDKSLAPILERLDAIEERLAQPAPVGQEDLSAVKEDVEALRKAIADLPAPAEAPTLPDIPSLINDAVAALPAPASGKDADPELIKQMVDDAVAALPAPKDGRDGKDGADGKDGRDGLDVVKFIRDSSDHLIAVLRDGTTSDLGEFVGKDGKDGKDGRDGFGFDEFDLAYDGKRSFILTFSRAGDVKQFAIDVPALLDQGVWREGSAYSKGDCVSFGGSLFIAQEDTSDKPETSKAWRLAVKRGRDGKDKA